MGPATDIAGIPDPDGETSLLGDALVAALDALGLTKEQLFADKALLTKILKYHVVSGVLNAAAVTSKDSLTTITDDQQELSVEVAGDIVKINNAKVIIPDVRAWNGVVHVIDAVLVPALPPPPTAAPTAAPTRVSSSVKVAFSVIAAPAILLQLF